MVKAVTIILFCFLVVSLSSFAGEPGSAEVVQSTPVSTSPSAQNFEFWNPGPRGKILSKDGKVYAETITVSNLALVWKNIDSDPEVVAWIHEQVQKIEQVLGFHLEVKETDLLQAYKLRRFQPFVLFENLSPEQESRFHDAHLDESNFMLLEVLRRKYPEKSAFAHGTGYVKRSQVKSSGIFKQGEVIQDKYTGAMGLERAYDADLMGADGRVAIATRDDQTFSEWRVLTEPKPGKNVRCTINSKIQDSVENAMKDIKTGAAVVIDVNSGEVVAMTSRPAFDPNLFIPRINPELWTQMSSDPKVPLMNRAVVGANPPGSTFKVITSLASMRAKVFDPDWIVDCDGKLQVGDVLYKLPAETNSVHYRDALVISCNTYFMTLGLKTGRDVLLAVARDMGIGQKTGIDLVGESSGQLPDPEYVRKTHHRLMGAGDVANTSIGQGDLLVTPLQAANWMAAVANGGTFYKLHLLSQIEDENGAVLKSVAPEILRTVQFPAADLEIMKDALKQVIEDGTGMPAQVPNLEFAAKTGTAQVGTKEKPRQVVWMNGYVPYSQPKYAFAVMIEGTTSEDLHGGEHAGAIVGKIFSKAFAVKAAPVDPE